MSLDLDRMEQALEVRAVRALEAACIEIQNEAKQILSVPAPRVTVSDRYGVQHYVAGWLINDAKRPDVNTIKIGRRYKVNKKTGKGVWTDVQYEPSPATPGAPPRKLSGRGRASVAREIDRTLLAGRVGTNVDYMGRHEYTGHPWLHVAVANVLPRLGGIFVDSFGSGP